MEIQRTRLSEIVLRRAPRLVVVSAPAGCGKSTFVRQLRARPENFAVCDCVDVRDQTDLSRAVLVAFAEARPALAAAIAQAQLGAAKDSRDWEAAAARFWVEEGPSTFVFENAEALTRSASASVLFERLIRAGDRLIIVCSRDVVPVPYGRGVDPTNVVTFGIDDLRFSDEEIRTALPDRSEREWAEIERISRGWPIVVELIGRAAREKPFAEVIASLGTVIHDELLVYLTSELIGDLSERERDLALVIAALPDARYADIARVRPSVTADDIERLALRVPLSLMPDGILRLHPMVAELMREHAGTRMRRIVKRVAEAAQAHGDETRAAELFFAAGAERAAAGALRDLGAFLMTTPTPRLAALITRFDEKTLLDFPALWCGALMHRGYSIPPYEWLRSAEALWSRLPANAEPRVRASIFSSLLNAHTNIGQCARAAHLLERYRETCVDSDPYGSCMATLWAAALDSFDGRYDRIPAYTKMLTPLLNASDLTHALYLYDVVSAIPRSRGEWDRDAEILGRARELFDRTQLSIALLGLVESAFARWFAGDDEQCDSFVAELEGRVTPANERGHRFFIACTRGAGEHVPYGYEKAKARAQGLLIASARAATRDAARRFASAAVFVADQSERRYLRILARCALALLDDGRRDELLGEAVRICAGLDSQPLLAALTALVERRQHAGMLAGFAARYEAVRRRQSSISVRVLCGEVLAREKPVTLSRSELAVLIALARKPRSFSVVELGDLLYPDLDADNAANRLHVYVHRLRQRLGRDAVLADATGYRLGSTVDVDLWELYALDARARGRGALGNVETFELAAAEPLSLPELDALALRLRLPEQFAGELRALLAHYLELRQALRSEKARQGNL